MRTLSTVTAACAALSFVAGSAWAQDVRRSVADAAAVLIGTSRDVERVSENLVIHRVVVERVLHGDVGEVVSVVDLPTLSLHVRPQRGQRRLFCLGTFERQARRHGLPDRWAPYYRLSPAPAAHPLVNSSETSQGLLDFVQIVLDSERGAGPRPVNDRLLPLIFEGPAAVRLEAVHLLTQRRVLLEALTPLQLSQLQARAVGEVDDVSFKVALAELLAERRLEGLVDALCLSIDAVEDRRFAESLGRIAKLMHGEDALEVLRPHLEQRRRADAHGRLLIALGATSTERALRALLRMRASDTGDRQWVDAALRLHGSPEALAVLRDDG